MPTPKMRWPAHAEDKRREAQQLADVNATLAREARRSQDENERKIKLAEIEANSERIARLMAEANARDTR